MNAPTQRMHQLDGLRGLLALHVSVYHLAGPLTQPGMSLSPLRPVLDSAWFAVDMFFVMSGFVMAHAYGPAFKERVSSGGLWRFLIARVARLYPVHLFALVVTAVGILPFIYDKPEFTSAGGRFSWTAALASLLMLHGPWIDHRSWNYPAWSISAEWHAYLLFPVLAPLFARLHAIRLKWLVVLGVTIPFLLYQSGVGGEPHPTNGPLVLVRVLPLFVAGAAAHALRAAPWVRSNAFAWLAVVGVPLLLLGPGTSAFAVLLAPCLLLVTMGHAVVRPCLSRPALVWLGSISYSLYMTHALVEMFGVAVALRWFSRFAGIDVAYSTVASGALLLSATLAALGVGALTWRWVEAPGRRFILVLARRPIEITPQSACAS
jgi:peptidoglycan/LPS O-acetylase OafA/YrhL